MTLVHGSRSMHGLGSLSIEARFSFRKHRDQARGTPYERYFARDVELPDDALVAIAAPMDPERATAPDRAGLDSLLDRDSHDVETGYCEMPDRSAYAASRVLFRGATPEMLEWWFWWHAVDPVRYALWHRYTRVVVKPLDPRAARGRATDDLDAGDAVDGPLGPDAVPVTVAFLDPSDVGFDTARFAEAGIVAHSCARVSLRWPQFEAATIVHLARAAEDGLEVRSRYWIGRDAQFRALWASSAAAGPTATPEPEPRMKGAEIAREQLLHTQTVFTHLSAVLADLYRDFGRGG
jgi:hypothetical protein